MTNNVFSAGFAIYRVVWRAPILRRNLERWIREAEWIGPVPNDSPTQ